MSAKLFLRVEWNETFWTRRDSFAPKKFSNFGPQILVEWIAPIVVDLKSEMMRSSLLRKGNFAELLFWVFNIEQPKTTDSCKINLVRKFIN